MWRRNDSHRTASSSSKPAQSLHKPRMATKYINQEFRALINKILGKKLVQIVFIISGRQMADASDL